MTAEPVPKRSSPLKNPYLWFFVFGAITITLLRPMLRHVPEPPEVGWQIPPYELTDQLGRPFGSADLAGNVYVVNFFFTSCPTICPPLMRAAAKLQRGFEEHGVEDVERVSITVDPRNDTPERLLEFGRALGVDPERWHLLTGDQEEIRGLIEGGFKVGVGVAQPSDAGPYDIAHSGRFFIVDPEGWTRCVPTEEGLRCGYGSDDTGLDEIFHRSQHVLKEARDKR